MTRECVDDLPLLLTKWERMGTQLMLEAHFPTQGTWLGLSLGWVSVV